ncbi:MAG: hypothetical protein A2033_05370 [Bacteroidetes bacterium GWA2_31_9]|nr:MAG: hypothetical protein A2033_05370 [Bacteroidetes bacterium GWA2_31_9]
MKTLLLFILFVLQVSIGFSKSDTIPKTSHRLFKVNVLYPGFEYEYGIGKLSTINFSTSLSFASIKEDKLNRAYFLNNILEIDFRQYYNLARRFNKRKNIKFNTADFISFNAIGIGKSIIENIDYESYSGIEFAVSWGFQRTYWYVFNVSFNAGIGYYFLENGNEGYDFLVNYKIGFLIGKRNIH